MNIYYYIYTIKGRQTEGKTKKTLAKGGKILYNIGMGRKTKKQAYNLSAEAAKKVDGLEEAKNNSALDAGRIEKDFLDILNYERKQSNNLLGDYINGEYSIPEQMRAKLVALPKKFGEIEGSTAYVSTRVGEFMLNFKVEFNLDPTFCKAKLYLIEVESGWEDDVKHLTLLDEDEQIYHPEYRKLMFEKWNVYYDATDMAKDEEIYAYLHMQSEEFLFRKELSEVLAQLYVVRLLALLDKLGEAGQKSKLEFKLSVEEQLENDPSFATNYTMQKRILDRLMFKNGTMAEVLKSDEGKKILDGYSQPIKVLRDKTVNPIIEGSTTSKAPAAKKEEMSSTPKVKKKSPVKGGKPSASSSPKYIPSTSSQKSEDSIREHRERMFREDPNFERRLQAESRPAARAPLPRIDIAEIKPATAEVVRPVAPVVRAPETPPIAPPPAGEIPPKKPEVVTDGLSSLADDCVDYFLGEKVKSEALKTADDFKKDDSKKEREPETPIELKSEKKFNNKETTN